MSGAAGRLIAPVVALTCLWGCRSQAPAPPLQASGYVEATEVKVASKVPGRVERVGVIEGQRVQAGETVVTLDTTETNLALQLARADRNQAAAQLQLLRAGARPEDIREAGAQLAAAQSEQRAEQAALDAATADVQRYQQLMAARAGAQKQLDDAVTRRDAAAAQVQAAADRASAAQQALAGLRAGARPQEIQAAEARVAAVDAQIATLQNNLDEATIHAPSGGVVTSRLVEPGELVAPGATLLVVVDLDRAWADVYVDEPLVPQLKLGEPATVVTDGGQRLGGQVAFISPEAEFTPRNVQTAEERAKLVYRVKVTVDNRAGVLKPGMPVTAEFHP